MNLKYKASLLYWHNTGKLYAGHDVPYRVYRKECERTREIPFSSELYPQELHVRKQLDFIVNDVDSLNEAFEKISTSSEFKKICGAKFDFLEGKPHCHGNLVWQQYAIRQNDGNASLHIVGYREEKETQKTVIIN